MEQVKRARMINTQQLEDVPELIQHIQSLLPAKEAACTCVLSKSWLHAWSTIPSIRFSVDSIKKQNQTKYMSWIYGTLLRYHRDNLPITALDLQFAIHPASRTAQKLLMQAASKSSIKELHLTILAAASFTLPDEIFSNENLNTLSIELIWPKPYYCIKNNSRHISSNPVIDCMNLRVLELLNVNISEEVLHKLLSTCKLLEKINLKLPLGLEKIKVNNLRYLHELKIATVNSSAILEIDDLPCLHSLLYDAIGISRIRPVLLKMDTIGSLRELYLDNVSMDDALSDMIKSNFPFLESLTLIIRWCSVEILDFRCVTLQSLKIQLLEEKQIEVQVYAPKLLFYGYTGFAVPSLLFPTIAPKQINLHLMLKNPTDHLFFLKIREALKLSSKFNIVIHGVKHGFLPFNIADVRTMVPFPATNVEKLCFLTVPKEGLLENIFDAVFSICHPVYVKSEYELRLKFANYFLKLIVKGVMENCKIRNPLNGRWVTPTSSLSLLNKMTPPVKCEFKLSWCSS